MNKERYLCIYPSGEVKWIFTDSKSLLTSFCREFNCEFAEYVPSVLPNIVLIVDEVSNDSFDPYLFNPIASRLYVGSFHPYPIFGPAVIAALHLNNGEFGLFPLTNYKLKWLAAFLHIDLPVATEEVM